VGELNKATSVVVQAGGQSRRFGRPKALMRIGDRPLIEHVLARVGDLGDECLVTTNRPQDFEYLGLRLAEDPAASVGAGALNGLATALRAAEGEHVLVVACDMPFVQTALATHLIDVAAAQAPEAVVVPRWERGFEPLLAVYPRRALDLVMEILDAGSQRMTDLLDRHPLRVVEGEELAALDPEGLSFFNVNTPEDLSRAEAIYVRVKHGKGQRGI
jgi:molybdopterin-guanine dinucleotide biosynthesis protein A